MRSDIKEEGLNRSSSNKQEWIKYNSHGGGRPVWHLSDGEGTACKSNGPISKHVESVCYVELIPAHGPVCAHCARRLMNRLKLNAVDSVKRELIKENLKLKEVIQCHNAPIVKKP